MPFSYDSGQIGHPIWLARGYPARAASRREKTSHFRFHVPTWKVQARTFLDMRNDETTAVFCVSKQETHDAAAGDPPCTRLSGAETPRGASSDCRCSWATCIWRASELLPRRHGVSRWPDLPTRWGSVERQATFPPKMSEANRLGHRVRRRRRAKGVRVVSGEERGHSPPCCSRD